MKKQILILISCVFCLLSLSACAKSVYVQDGESKLVMTNNNLAESDSLVTLLDRAKTVSNIRYDIVSGQPQITQKFWFKGKKMRMETGQTVSIYNQDEQLMYVYTPAENTAIKMSLGLGQHNQESIIDEAVGLEQYMPEAIGSEVIGGKNCLVILYKWGGTMTRMWLWKKYGLPIKIETDDGKSKTTVIYENFDFSPISDNMFELPKDVKITDMTNLPDIKDFNLPEIK